MGVVIVLKEWRNKMDKSNNCDNCKHKYTGTFTEPCNRCCVGDDDLWEDAGDTNNSKWINHNIWDLWEDAVDREYKAAWEEASSVVDPANKNKLSDEVKSIWKTTKELPKVDIKSAILVQYFNCTCEVYNYIDRQYAIHQIKSNDNIARWCYVIDIN
jgi:hypothetical protein